MLSDLKLLSKIASNNGIYNTLQTSTGKLSTQLEVSQQTISRRLMEMAEAGIIQRELRADGINLRLTAKGKDMLEQEYILLKSVFKEGREGLKGKLTTGEGEGAYYIKQYSEKLKTCLGFTPYAGTLNVKVDEEEGLLFINKLSKQNIKKFKTKEREFGGLDCYKIKIGEMEAGIIAPDRTRHGKEIMEVVAPVFLRGHFKLKDNDTIQLGTGEIK